MGLSKKAIAIALAGVLVAAVVITPALGGPSLKKLVKKEVSKQLRDKQGPQGAQGPQGPQGAQGANFNANATLSPGETLTGVWAAAGGSSANAPAVIQFVPQLLSDLPATAVHRNPPGGSTPNCPGPGQAARGQFCLYERASTNANFNVITNPATGDNGANRRGAVAQYTTTASAGYADGTWAVTAP